MSGTQRSLDQNVNDEVELPLVSSLVNALVDLRRANGESWKTDFVGRLTEAANDHSPRTAFWSEPQNSGNISRLSSDILHHIEFSGSHGHRIPSDGRVS